MLLRSVYSYIDDPFLYPCHLNGLVSVIPTDLLFRFKGKVYKRDINFRELLNLLSLHLPHLLQKTIFCSCLSFVICPNRRQPLIGSNNRNL